MQPILFIALEICGVMVAHPLMVVSSRSAPIGDGYHDSRSAINWILDVVSRLPLADDDDTVS
jgi:hypothetical protein